MKDNLMIFLFIAFAVIVIAIFLWIAGIAQDCEMQGGTFVKTWSGWYECVGVVSR